MNKKDGGFSGEFVAMKGREKEEECFGGERCGRKQEWRRLLSLGFRYVFKIGI